MNEKVIRTLEFDKIRERVVNDCTTPYGQELALQIRPLDHVEAVRHALDLAEAGEFYYRISGIIDLPVTSDLRSAVNVARLGGILSALDLVGLGLTTKKSRQLARQIAHLAEDHEQLQLLTQFLEPLTISREFDEEIEHCLDASGEVLDRASSALKTVRSDIRGVQARIKRTLEEMLRSPSIAKHLQETIVTLRGDRYCLAVKAESQGHIRGFIHDVSASGATVFIEPERVVQLGNSLRQLENQEKKEIEKILQQLSGLVTSLVDQFAELFSALGVIDYILAKAKFAHDLRAVKPVVKEAPLLKIRAGRHPLLDAHKVVPLDLRLGQDFHQLVITGPNTGGKTVALKTAGLFVLMALSGLYLPALEGTEVGWFSEVFADIGDEQSIEQSLSTFSSHMVNIIQILQAADETSLLLFDELGAGTDPTEGAALALAILDDLRRRGIRALATTHYTELKAYAYTTPDVMNASVEFDVETLAPTYRLLIGVPGKSNAFAIAARLGLNQQLIEQAASKIASKDARIDDMIAKLQVHMATAEKEAQALAATKEEAEQITEQLRLQLAQEEKIKEDRTRRMQDELRTYVRKVEREAEELLGELRERKAENQMLKDHERTEMRKQIEGWLPATNLRKGERIREKHVIHPGDEVKVLSFGGQTATVLEKSAGEWVVAVGVMKMKVPEKDLELLRRAAKVPKPAALVRRSTSLVKSELDLRGKTVDEAIHLVDQYLDQAVMAGYPQVTLIHGKGTGALRKGIMDYLRSHPHVETARSGGEGEGGLGVTIVELK